MAEGCGCEKDTCHISIQNPLTARDAPGDPHEATELQTGVPSPHWSRRLMRHACPRNWWQRWWAHSQSSLQAVGRSWSTRAPGRTPQPRSHAGLRVRAPFQLEDGPFLLDGSVRICRRGRSPDPRDSGLGESARGDGPSRRGLGVAPTGDCPHVLFDVRDRCGGYGHESRWNDGRNCDRRDGGLRRSVRRPCERRLYESGQVVWPGSCSAGVPWPVGVFVGPAVGAVSAIFVYGFVHPKGMEVAKGGHGCCE